MYLLITIAVVGAAVLAMMYATSIKSRWGIPLGQVSCPKCGAQQPKVRKPNGWNEALWGGYTCQQCGVKMDKYGRIRA